MAWLDLLDTAPVKRAGRQLLRNVDRSLLPQAEALYHGARSAGGELADEAQTAGLRMVRRAQSAGHSLAHDAGTIAHDAGTLASSALHQVVDFGRAEAPVVARMARDQALRTSRAVRADPVPVVVGAVGVLLLASLILGRRRR